MYPIILALINFLFFQKLKQFLHPECKMCDTLFHTRLEWDDHKLSSDHLRKVGEQRRQFNPDLKDDEFELLDVIVIEDDKTEELPVASKVDMLQDQEIKEEDDDEDKHAIINESVNAEEPVVETEKINIKEEEINEEKVTDIANEENENDIANSENDNVQEVNDNADEVNDSVQEGNDDTKDESIKKEKDEKYNPANVVGRELVVRTGGFVCRLCAMFMKNEEEADLHCQTASHYINFTTITKLHVSIMIVFYNFKSFFFFKKV